MILVTGATGFLGRSVIEELIKRSEKVRCIVRNSKSSSFLDNYDVEKVYVNDVFNLNEEVLVEILSGVSCVIHLGWFSKQSQTYDAIENLECLTGTINLAKTCIKSGVKKFVGIGTCAEYKISDIPLRTDSELNPTNLYGATKAAAYFVLRELFKNTDTNFLWCRPFYLYGDNDSPHKLYNYLHENISKGHQARLSKGDQVRDFISSAEAAYQIVSHSLGDKFGAVNICSGEQTTVKKFAENIADEYSARHLLFFDSTKSNTFDPPFVVGVK